MGGATCPPKFVERGRKRYPSLFHTWMCFAKGSTHPTRCIRFNLSESPLRAVVVSPSCWFLVRICEKAIDSLIGGARRIGGAKRYPSPDVQVSMGIAALHPSYRELLRPYARIISIHTRDRMTRRANHSKPCPAPGAKIFRLTCRANQH
jgi:hypothetical protein